MKVIVNALGYVGQSDGAGGAGVFLQYLISHLAGLCDVDVLIEANSKNFRATRCKARLIELPHLTADTLRQLQSGPTVVLDPFGGLPCERFPEDLALCVIVHDLMHLERPHFFTRAERDARSTSFAQGLQRADVVVTFSQDQARAIRRYFSGAQPVVIPHLPYMMLDRDAVAVASRALPAGVTRFVLYPGVRWPHKNHKTVIEAFDAYVKLTGSDLVLILCGAPCAEQRFSFSSSRESSSKQIVDLGLVSNEMLRFLFLKAEAILFPTLYEGFGIPVLEAAYQGKMLAASGLAVFDEILGSTAYRRVVAPLCHMRWLEAFSDIEGSGRATYESRVKAIRQQVSATGFIDAFMSLLKRTSERYSHPALYPLREFASGDRLTSSVIAELSFIDVYDTALVTRGTRHAALGTATPEAQASAIYRSAHVLQTGKQCLLRAQFNVAEATHPSETPSSLQFYSWFRLLDHANLDGLQWSVNDRNVSNILPMLRDGNWHLFRTEIPQAGYIDLRGVRSGQTEVTGFDIEIHNAAIVKTVDLPPPAEERQALRLTLVVAALRDRPVFEEVIRSVVAVNAALPSAHALMHWILVTRVNPRTLECPAETLPTNLRVHFVAGEDITRQDATDFISPYEPLRKLLLLEAEDVPCCLQKANLEALAMALGPMPANSQNDLTFTGDLQGFWLKNERGRIMDVGDRVGEPIPVLDPGVIRLVLGKRQPSLRPRFAVIETDTTSKLSHHALVTQLFLEGARAVGFQPILGLHGSGGISQAINDVRVWAGFSPQVYSVGTADCFADELGQFVEALDLDRDDIVFIHSLSPQILLGAARFIAANPDSAPSFIMRFFSTAEAMAGHKLSYVKILRSIENVKIVRRKMHFFCEGKNLIEYFNAAVGCTYPLLFNPEHPGLALVRDSAWFDPNFGGGRTLTLAYLGEAREEKGFEDLPAIVGKLLEADSLSNFQFLLQTGSNRDNDTPKIARARAALSALKAKYPGRVRTVDSVETPEQFYFLMKHARGIIAPYKPSAYSKRGSGVILEALQMGLDVFVWADTDLYATFKDTGRVFGVSEGSCFADAVIDHYASNVPKTQTTPELPISQSPEDVCKRLLALCAQDVLASAQGTAPILWVGNDTSGEGCSAVYASQKHALRALGRDCFEIFVPWPDPNWSGVAPGAYDQKIYGFGDGCESTGIAWIAQPTYSPSMISTLREVEESGPTYERLRRLNSNFVLPEMLKRAIRINRIQHALLNYVHLYPVVKEFIPLDRIVCETHDINAYQHAVRRGSSVSLREKIEEFSDLARFKHIVAISAEEEREISGACPTSNVYWRLPPFIPQLPPPVTTHSPRAQVDPLYDLGGMPDSVTQPSGAMLTAYYTRPDLRSRFDLSTGDGRVAFFRWWVLCGQLDAANGFGLTQDQLKWLTSGPSNGEAAMFSGLLKLIVLAREDLRRYLGGAEGVDVDALVNWDRDNSTREFGISLGQLLQCRRSGSAGVQASRSVGARSALNAVLESKPIMHLEQGAVEALLRRLIDVEEIDLVLVGSGHPSNVMSFRWFIEEIYLRYFAVKGRNLFIIGSVCDALRDIEHRSLFRIGRCAHLRPILAASRACPLPVIMGSGAAIKAIPALAVNGAVTITDHLDRAFRLLDYGIPAFSEPRDFADDLWALLTDKAHRDDRQRRASRYVEDKLTLDGYVRFWESLLASIGA